MLYNLSLLVVHLKKVHIDEAIAEEYLLFFSCSITHFTFSKVPGIIDFLGYVGQHH